MDYFDYCTGLRMTNDKFDVLFGGPARGSEPHLTQREMDLAASIQAVIEEAVLRLTRAFPTLKYRRQCRHGPWPVAV